MPLPIARRHAWSLAKTLMVCITLFRSGDAFGVMPSAEYDGDPVNVLAEYDPFG